MNPETFTLGALFKMGLHNFDESISEIVTAAVKEMSIEKGLKEVADVWDNEKFRRVFKKHFFILLMCLKSDSHFAVLWTSFLAAKIMPTHKF